MKKINHPHDKLFKETFGDLEVTRDFIKNYLPGEISDIIDVGTLAAMKDSFIEPKLRDAYSDLLFSVNMDGHKGYLYFLFEHKSYQAPDIAFQLLGYMLQIWNQLLAKEKANELPVIIPLIIYHGSESWKNPKTIGEQIRYFDKFPLQIQRCVPNYEFYYYDFSFDGKEEIKGNNKLQAYLELAKHIFVRDIGELIDALITIEKMLGDSDLNYFDTVLLYVLGARDDVPVETLKTELSKEGRKRLMSIAEQLRSEGEKEGLKRGKLEGKIEGVQEGELKKAREMAKKLLRLNLDKEKIIEITDLSVGEIERIEKDMQ